MRWECEFILVALGRPSRSYNFVENKTDRLISSRTRVVAASGVSIVVAWEGKKEELVRGGGEVVLRESQRKR